MKATGETVLTHLWLTSVSGSSLVWEEMNRIALKAIKGLSALSVKGNSRMDFTPEAITSLAISAKTRSGLS